MDGIKYPNVNIRLVGLDGNAFGILGRCQVAARKAGLTRIEINEFLDEATSGDYNHLLRTCMKYFSCDEEIQDWEE